MSQSVAAISAATSQAQVQMAIAAKIAKMNAGAERSVATLVEAAQDNLQKIASTPPAGSGGVLDISV
jgi:hypothetical protein